MRAVSASRRGGVVASLMMLFACDSSYPMSFVCASDAGPECPPEQACPELPLGPNTCGDLPGVLGHDPIPAKVGRPPGCRARMPYGNPHYGGHQVICDCRDVGSPSWRCPI
jgi:hypothetical protein